MQNKTSKALAEIKSAGALPRVEHYLAEIAKRDGEYGAFLDLFPDMARSQAKAVDAKIKAGKPLGKLGGLVLAIKNSVAIKGCRLTCGSKMLEHYVVPYSATAIERIIAEDGIIIGSTNIDEFSCGSDC